MTLLADAEVVLRDAGFDVQRMDAQSAGVTFENDTVLGFLLTYDTPAGLLAEWAALADLLVAQRQFQLRAAGKKAWNAYLVLLATKPADYAEAAALNSVEEDLSGLRKITRAGLTCRADVSRALISLLPFQAAPILVAVDSRAEIRQRTTELPPKVVEAFLSQADTSVVFQILEETL